MNEENSIFGKVLHFVFKLIATLIAISPMIFAIFLFKEAYIGYLRAKLSGENLSLIYIILILLGVAITYYWAKHMIEIIIDDIWEGKISFDTKEERIKNAKERIKARGIVYRYILGENPSAKQYEKAEWCLTNSSDYIQNNVRLQEVYQRKPVADIKEVKKAVKLLIDSNLPMLISVEILIDIADANGQMTEEQEKKILETFRPSELGKFANETEEVSLVIRE